MQSQSRLAASDTLEKASLGAKLVRFQRFDSPHHHHHNHHRILSFSSLIDFIVLIHVSMTKEGLDDERIDMLSENHSISIGIIVSSEVSLPEQS